MSEAGEGTARPRIGFIGLGRMGVPLAANIARAGFPLTVWNRTPAKAEAFAATTVCEVASSPAELARRSDVVVTMVADGGALEAIFAADVLDALSGGTLLDMSTTGPKFAVGFARRLRAHDVAFVEAPVSGSTKAATEATLTILLGAEPEDVASSMLILRELSAKVVHLGPPGTASLAKLAINNLIYGINQCLAESLVLAERGGLDRVQIYDAFLASAAAAPVMSYRRDAFLDPDGVETTFTLALAEKDLRLTTELADELRSPMPQAQLNRRLARQAMSAGLADRDVSIVAEYLRATAMTEAE